MSPHPDKNKLFEISSLNRCLDGAVAARRQKPAEFGPHSTERTGLFALSP